MKLKTAGAAASAAAILGGVALCSPAFAQNDGNGGMATTTTTTATMQSSAPSTEWVVVGEPPDVEREQMMSMSGMNATAMPGGGANGPMMTVNTNGKAMVQGAGPVTVEGVTGDWVVGSDYPVFPAMVVSSDPLLERAVVRSAYGYTAVNTGAGARVLYKDRLVNWLTVPPGQVVQLPVTYLVEGVSPRRVQVTIPAMTDYYTATTQALTTLRGSLSPDMAAIVTLPTAPSMNNMNGMDGMHNMNGMDGNRSAGGATGNGM